MFRCFEASTADQVWGIIAAAFYEGSQTAPQASRAGHTREILHAAITLGDPRQRWVISRDPPLNPAFALAEVIWILNGRNDAGFLCFFNRKLPDYAGCGPTFHGAYGHRLRRHLSFDQLRRAYDVLRRNPDSRQVVLQIWDGRIDLPGSDGGAVSPDIPCNLVSLLKIRNGALEWTQIMRSSDAFRGLPYNLVQFTSLQEIMAGWLGVRLGAYSHLSDSLHVYEADAAHMRHPAAATTAPNTDDLAVPIEESEKAFAALASCVERLIAPDLSAAELERVICSCRMDGFGNMLRVLCAESARRRKWHALIDAAMEQCTNPALALLWSRWLSRVGLAADCGERGRAAL